MLLLELTPQELPNLRKLELNTLKEKRMSSLLMERNIEKMLKSPSKKENKESKIKLLNILKKEPTKNKITFILSIIFNI